MAVSKVLQRKMFRDPSQDENVGIMQGFMDDVHEMLGVDDMFDEEPGEEEDGGVAKAMGRRPNSPEILMNNLRGDMRSVDARIEELAEMVGYNAAASTPPEVLALLQPVLKQQGIAALEAAAPAMPDMGMAPPGMPDMGMAPPPAMEGGIGSLPQGNMGQPPVQMARGGPVQYFQDGSDGAGVTPVDDFTYPPELQAALRERILSQIGRGAVPIPDLMQRTQELGPQYKTLLGIDPSVSKGQMLFDVAQAALNYAGNVNPQGQSLRGSQAARLAGAVSGLPGAIGARAAEAQKQNQAIRMAAMQGAQSEIDAARATNTSREDTLDKMAIEAMKNSGKGATLLSLEDAAALGLDPNQRWQVKNGTYSIAGGRDLSIAQTATPLIEAEAAKAEQAQKSLNNIARLDSTIRLIQEGQPITGFGADIRLNLERGKAFFNGLSPESRAQISDTELLAAALGQDVFGAITALGVGARGLDTPAERVFLQKVLAGDISLTEDTLLGMAQMRRTVEANALRDYNARLTSPSYKALMGVNPIPGLMRTEPFVIPRTPLEKSYIPGIEDADLLTAEDRIELDAELARLRAEQARRSNTQGSNQ
tara:strand:+ start:1415 stop:3193 length:1779 start_codon:yes stop_codon:yes gene_type:complete